MPKRDHPKLTDAEIKRLEKFYNDNEGQQAVATKWGVSVSTLSRLANKHSGPSPLMRKTLAEAGVVKS